MFTKLSSAADIEIIAWGSATKGQHSWNVQHFNSYEGFHDVQYKLGSFCRIAYMHRAVLRSRPAC